MKHYNVVITTPGSSMASGYVKSLLSTVNFLQANGISWHYQNETSSLVTNAREATITGSRNLEIDNPSPGKGEYTYDKIFCIDSDILWSPSDFMKLYKSDYDVVSGVYYEAQGKDAVIHQYKNSHRMMTRQELNQINQPFKVYGVGLGFVCAKKGVFESLKRPWYGLGKVQTQVGNTIYDIPLGEDLFWCERVADSGKEIWVDPQVRLGHIKTNIVF